MTKYVLSIGGLDSLSGGGIVADVTTINSLNAFALSALTSIVAVYESTTVVESVPVAVLKNQLHSIMEATELDAVKIGLAVSIEQIAVISDFLQQLRTANANLPVVLDPVFSFKEDSSYSNLATAQAICDSLLKYATVVTPNLNEYHLLRELIDCNSNSVALNPQLQIVVKDVLAGDEIAQDELYNSKFENVHQYQLPRLTNSAVNGAGCVFSAALTTYLTQDYQVIDAVKLAKQYAYHAIEQSVPFAVRPSSLDLSQQNFSQEML